MSNPGGECPICKIRFLDDDDVVTCPSCGAPYHRECYVKKGHCIYEDKHASGFEYHNPSPAAKVEAAGAAYQSAPSPAAGAAQTGSVGGTLCSSCKTVNDARNIFCENCGSPLHAHTPTGGVPNGGTAPNMGHPGPTPAMMNGVFVDMHGEIDGIPKNDWAQYIGKSAPVYLYRMGNMQRNNSKISFMASPFLFGTFYFAYRKAWGWAALTLLVKILLVVPQFLLALSMGGIALPAFLTADSLEIAFYAASYISLAVRIILGLFGMQMFRTSAAKKMKKLKAENENPQDYYKALLHSGGTSTGAVLAAAGVIIVLYTIFYILFKDALVAYTLATFPGLRDLL